MTEQEYGSTTINEITTDISNNQERDSVRWESFTDEFIETIKTSQVYIDCGAEYGFYIRLALKYGPKDIRIVGFEPEPIRFKLLQDSLAAFPNVTIRPEAVADMGSDWSMIKVAVGVSASFDGFLHPEGNRFNVRTIALDDQYTKVDVIKMDIEGAEDLAIDGMIELLCKSKPVLFTEFHPISGSWQTMMRLASEDKLRRIGYQIDNAASIVMDHGGRTVLRAV